MAGPLGKGVFRPDYQQFLTSRNTNDIESVRVFKETGVEPGQQTWIGALRFQHRNWKRLVTAID